MIVKPAVVAIAIGYHPCNWVQRGRFFIRQRADPREQPLGRTGPRIRCVGRTDDMLIVRGVNVFPTAVEDVIRSQPGTTGEYLIIVDDSIKDPATGFLTGLKLKVEAAPNAPCDFGEQLAGRIRERLTVRAAIEVVEAGSLPRAVHKAKRLQRS